MLRNYLRTILRSIWIQKLFSAINIIGLAVGMAACIIIAHYSLFHLSFDQYHEKANEIYRVHIKVKKEDVDNGIGSSVSAPTGPTLLESSPAVRSFTRFKDLDYQNNSLVYRGGEQIIANEQRGVYLADTSTFSMFNFPFLAGGNQDFFKPGTMIITRKVSDLYFDAPEKAVGEVLTLAGNTGEFSFEVVGVLENIRPDSHLQFEVLISMSSAEKNQYTDLSSWTNNSFLTYLQIPRKDDLTAVKAQLIDLAEAYVNRQIEDIGYLVTNFYLVPLPELHYTSHQGIDFISPVDKRLIVGLGIVAIIILLIAWINYLNLSLVKTLDRMKEIGIRKILGSQESQITALFMLEALFINLFAFLLALTLVQISSPFVSNLTSLKFNIFEEIDLILLTLLVVLAGSTLVGLYPATAMKLIDLTQVIRSKTQVRFKSGLGTRNALISIQFIVTFLMLSVALTVYLQLDYMKNAELGFQRENILVLEAPPEDINGDDRESTRKFNSYSNDLEQYTDIKATSMAGMIPGEPITWGTNMYVSSRPAKTSVETRMIACDHNYLEFFELGLIAGRGMRRGDSPWSSKDVFINEKMAESLGFYDPDDAIGQPLTGFYAPLEIRGVVENHHHNSLHVGYEPIAYIISGWTEYYFIKYDNSLSEEKIVELAQTSWSEYFKDDPFDYFFLDSFYNRQYSDDEKFGNIFTTFSIVALIIACLGLFGLTAFTLQQRTKEIGIRKVLGADRVSLAMTFVKNYLLLIIIAYIIAMPIAWVALQRWLENYEFHITLDWWLAVVPLAIILFVSLGTVFSRLYAVIRRNPAESLRYE